MSECERSTRRTVGEYCGLGDAVIGVADPLSPTNAPDDDETVDPTFDPNVNAQSDTAHQFESFCEN